MRFGHNFEFGLLFPIHRLLAWNHKCILGQHKLLGWLAHY